MGYWRNSDTTHCLESSRTGRYASRRILLFCLFLMVGCSSCDRFGQEKSQDAGGAAEQVEKMPLPRRAAEPSKVAAQAAPVEKKPAAPETSKPGAPAATAAAKQTPQSKQEGKNVSPSAAGEKKPLPAAGGAQVQKGAVAAKGEAKGAAQVDRGKSPATAAKPAVAEKTPPAAKPAAVVKKQAEKEQAAALAAKKKPQTPAATTSGGRWTVVMGPYLLEETLASDLTKVRRAGLSATIQPTARKKAAMNRLYLAQFDDRAAAQAELDKLKRYTSDAFILEHAGKHSVFAGSYLLDSRAVSEKERLAAAGFNLTLKRSDVAIPSKRMVVGTYRDRGAAENVQKKLKGAGVKGTLVRQ